ncbi:hypothetical protein B7463_g4852, partial [Scytalidium lignicola]
MPTTTEVVILKFQRNVNIEDSSTKHGQARQDTLKTVAAQPGYQRSFWTVVFGDGTTVWWLIDWDSYDAHKAFMDSKAYKPFQERAAIFLDLTTPPKPFHVNFWTPPSEVLKTGPVVELVTFYFPFDSDNAKIEEMQKKAIEGFRKAGGGPHAMAGGLVIENELEIPSKPRHKTKAVTALLA